METGTVGDAGLANAGDPLTAFGSQDASRIQTEHN